MIDKIKQLNQELIEARHFYYVENKPKMSDLDYDKKERELKALIDEYPEHISEASVLTTVGSDLKDSSNRYKHSSPMLSLENMYLEEDLEKWYDELPQGTVVAVEPKVDGLSCSLRYVNRKLVLATTRGDGEVGEDVTAQVFASPSIPKELRESSFPVTPIEIRGEIFMRRDNFDRLNQEAEKNGTKAYANQRNLASGTLKMKDLEEVKRRDLRFQPWQVEGLASVNRDSIISASSDLEYIYRYGGFRQPQVTLCRSKQALLKTIQILGQDREKNWSFALGLPTDGVVIKVENANLRKKLGYGTKFSKFACAYKYQSLSNDSFLVSVVWQTGRGGKITPVGIMEPINVGGSMISRVTLNNLSYIKNFDLALKDRISITKSGDVIPMVTAVIERPADRVEITAPTQCPECSEDTVQYMDERSKVLTVYCPSLTCTGKLKEHLTYIGQRTMLDVQGLGPEIAAKFVEEGVVQDIGDLYVWAKSFREQQEQYDEEDIIEAIKEQGFPVAQTMELVSGITSSLNLGWDRWLAALGIPGVGLVLAKKLAIYLNLSSEDMANIPNILSRLDSEEEFMEGIGVKKLEAISNWRSLEMVQDMCTKLYEAGVRPKSLKPVTRTGDLPFSGLNMLVTGEIPEIGDREFIESTLVSLGATIKGVSKKLSILIAGDAPGPSKITKAKSLGINIEDKDWLIAVFKDNNIKFQPKFDVEEEMDI